MASAIRDYFDAKVPVAPGEGRPPAPPVASRDWRGALKDLSKATFVTLPNQLDRTRVNRNKFLRAVR